MNAQNTTKRPTCIQCGADLTQSSTHTLMDCIAYLRQENRRLREAIERLNNASSPMDQNQND